MGYSGARGGLEAILAAEDLVRRKRDHAPATWASTEQITARFRLAVDRVTGEAGLYDEPTAADAFRQAEGDTLEASHLLRAQRSTLPRRAVGEPVDPGRLLLLLDELVSALDPANREAALELVDSLAGRDAAVLAVFHDMDAIRRLASRAVFVGDGRIARQGAPDRTLEAAA
ncbi:carbon-phosphorus lyase complex subunit PhnI [Streptomyces sp. 5-10]|uniref:carbon-phosphorus lyase complex subunit PhnI n=1 Tax=Streptomyces sp. 5-10 TaxID=878925 RepID=UPI00168C0B5B|nr:carbon-phosphorus lyase complex subunit PhnI [Streptomyces sp. 5-10]MBD3002668.1 carbon-phosphorus lyase complex subunit PhnI [Streptomyces sp. 5-10]